MKRFRKVVQVVFLAAISLVFVNSVPARDLKASLPQLPPLVESADKGFLVDLVKAMDMAYPEGAISIKVYPFVRAIDNVVSGSADFEMPLLVNPEVSEASLPFAYSTDTIFDVIFVLYSHKGNNAINPANLAKYKIETDRAHVKYFNFPIIASNSIKSSLKKVDVGRIDGYIFAMPETDGVLKELGLKNIKRTKYKTFKVKIVIPKGEKGKTIDHILSSLIQKLKKSGEYERIMGPLLNQQFQE